MVTTKNFIACKRTPLLNIASKKNRLLRVVEFKLPFSISILFRFNSIAATAAASATHICVLPNVYISIEKCLLLNWSTRKFWIQLFSILQTYTFYLYRACVWTWCSPSSVAHCFCWTRFLCFVFLWFWREHTKKSINCKWMACHAYTLEIYTM